MMVRRNEMKSCGYGPGSKVNPFLIATLPILVFFVFWLIKGPAMFNKNLAPTESVTLVYYGPERPALRYIPTHEGLREVGYAIANLANGDIIEVDDIPDDEANPDNQITRLYAGAYMVTDVGLGEANVALWHVPPLGRLSNEQLRRHLRATAKPGESVFSIRLVEDASKDLRDPGWRRRAWVERHK